MTMKSLLGTVSLALLLGSGSVAAQAQIAIGHLADYSGGTSDVGTPYGQAVVDTFAWVNKNGGVGGKQLAVDTNDYGYQVPRAIALYKKWSGGDKVAGIMGWGTADTEALTGFLAQDKIPDISASYAAALTDPEGISGKASMKTNVAGSIYSGSRVASAISSRRVMGRIVVDQVCSSRSIRIFHRRRATGTVWPLASNTSPVPSGNGRASRTPSRCTITVREIWQKCSSSSRRASAARVGCIESCSVAVNRRVTPSSNG